MTDEGPRGWGRPLHAAVLDATGIAAIDVDPAAVALAAAEVPEGVFTVGDAPRPPSGPFDVVAAVQLLMHVADPVAVLAAAERAGAVVAATVWGRERECDIRLFGEALAR